MKIAVISDIHGNYEAFLNVLEDIEKKGVDTIISLGDNIGYGADSEKVIQLVRSLNIISVLGNHELAVLDDRVRSWFKNDAAKAIDHTIMSLSEDSKTFIQTMAYNLSLHNCGFVHGFPPDSVRFYIHQIDEGRFLKTFDAMTESICFVGHTHKLNLVYPGDGRIHWKKLDTGKRTLGKEKKYVINAGSVGQPRDGSFKAQYVIWNPSLYELEVRAVSYDVAAAVKKIEVSGIPKRYAQILEGKIIF
jgi:predicted phosphodiesterase